MFSNTKRQTLTREVLALKGSANWLAEGSQLSHHYTGEKEEAPRNGCFFFKANKSLDNNLVYKRVYSLILKEIADNGQ